MIVALAKMAMNPLVSLRNGETGAYFDPDLYIYVCDLDHAFLLRTF